MESHPTHAAVCQPVVVVYELLDGFVERVAPAHPTCVKLVRAVDLAGHGKTLMFSLCNRAMQGLALSCWNMNV